MFVAWRASQPAPLYLAPPTCYPRNSPPLQSSLHPNTFSSKVPHDHPIPILNHHQDTRALQSPSLLAAGALVANTMPSLPISPEKPAKAMPAQDVSSSRKYREAEYHLDGKHRCVAQSYEVRPPSRPSSATSSPRMQHVQSARHSSSSESSASAKLSSSKIAQSKTVVVVQSPENAMQGAPDDNAKAAKASTLGGPPPAPRPRRLPTPELPDVKSDQSFCHCDAY